MLAEVSAPSEGSRSFTIRSEGVTVLGMAFSLRQSDARIAICGAGWLEVDTDENADLAEGFQARMTLTVETLRAGHPTVFLVRVDTTRLPTYRMQDAAMAGELPFVVTDYEWDPMFGSVTIDFLTEPDPADRTRRRGCTWGRDANFPDCTGAGCGR